MKKLLTVLALLLIALSLFAAGAKEEAKSSEKIELTFWSPFTGGDGEFFDAMIKAGAERIGTSAGTKLM